MAGRVVSLRLPAELVDAVDAVAGAGARSRWMADAAQRKLMGEHGDPLDQLTFMSERLVESLEGCDEERRRELRPVMQALVQAYKRGGSG